MGMVMATVSMIRMVSAEEGQASLTQSLAVPHPSWYDLWPLIVCFDLTKRQARKRKSAANAITLDQLKKGERVHVRIGT